MSDSFELFKEYEVTSVLLVRAEEEKGSTIVGDIQVGSTVTVLEIGSDTSGRRVKVTDATGKTQGWVTCITAKGEPALRKQGEGSRLRSNSLTSIFSSSSRTSISSKISRISRLSLSSSTAALLNKPDPGLALEPRPQIGDLLETTINKVTLREGEALTSVELKKLQRGTQLRVEDLGWATHNRVKVCASELGLRGWVSILDKAQNLPLLGRRAVLANM